VQKAKKRVGRPTRPPRPGERVTLGLRVSAEMKRKLEKDAIKNGRSLSQEAEFRLERSYDRDEIFTHLALFKDDLRAGIEAWLEGGEKRKKR
jgi:hypothetical protein